MQLQQYPTFDGRKVWLTPDELDRLLDEYHGEISKSIALSMMGKCGLRSAEVVDVTPADVIKGDQSNRWFIRIRSGKGEKE